MKVVDLDAHGLALRTSQLSCIDPICTSRLDPETLPGLMEPGQIVISLLPPPMHPMVARACLKVGANLLTASYESEEMQQMAEEIKAANLIFLNECGLDPGIDHMSAMELIHQLKGEGASIFSFKSYCGGLTADPYDENPFRYKISWNPRNVVLAGKAGARFLSHGRQAVLPYQRMFAEAEDVMVPGWGAFEAYPNRDSVPYARLYGLEGIKELKRGTLRKKGFCERWNLLVQSGLTNDELHLDFSPESTVFDWLSAFFPELTQEKKNPFSSFSKQTEVAKDVFDMGFSSVPPMALERTSGTSADFLLDLIVKKWALKPGDQDLVVMVHQFQYEKEGRQYQTTSSFGVVGKDETHTAMAKTVGLPLGICARLILEGNIKQKGLVLPLEKGIYQPVLRELSQFGITFETTTHPL